jgi:hypothetical protein
MSPPPEETTEDIASEIRRNMELIIKYYDTINARSINIQKELHQLRYLLELKKSRTVKELTDDDKKQYETKQKMYLSKLNKKEILNPKDTTSNYYKIKFDNDVYIIDNP